MKDDAVFNIKFVQAVEKHPCLYNNTLAEYSRKDISDNAWKVVAEEVDETVPYCKEKWKNIRSVFVRTLKPQPPGTSKFRKPYYLNDAMKFILPYVKAGPTVLDVSESMISPLSYEDVEDPLASADTSQEEIDVLENDGETYRMSNEMKITKKRKFMNAYDSTTELKDRNSHRGELNPRKMFLLGLVPEVNDLTEYQMRQFRRRVLRLIDDIRSTSSSNYSENISTVFVSGGAYETRNEPPFHQFLTQNLESKTNDTKFHCIERKLFKDTTSHQL